MPLDMTAVCTALANQVMALAVPYLRMALDPEDQINPPQGLVMPGRPYLMYGGTFAGNPLTTPASATPTDFNLDIVLVIAKSSTMDRQQQSLDQWIDAASMPGSVSVPTAVALDPTLGGAVAWCQPTSTDPPGPLNWNGLEYFGTRIHFNLSSN